MGMAILNVKSTDFIIYASFDGSFMIMNIIFDEQYITYVLSTVKSMYLYMLHFVCLKENF